MKNVQLRPLPADEAAVRRYVEDLWLPYHRDIEATVEDHALADGVDITDEEAAFRLEWLEDDDCRIWVAVDAPDEGSRDVDLDDLDGDFAGFIGTSVAESPSVFDRPDRLIVCDIYVRERYRGTGLARDLIDRAVAQARESGIPELALDVDADNGRAVAFYEKLGFETARRRMRVAVDDV